MQEVKETFFLRYPTPTLLSLNKRQSTYYLVIEGNKKTTEFKLFEEYNQSKDLVVKVWGDLKFKHEISEETLHKLNSIK